VRRAISHRTAQQIEKKLRGLGDPAVAASSARFFKEELADKDVFLSLSYVDGAVLSPGWKWLVRLSAPGAAILLPTAFFLSVLSPGATEPNPLIYLAYVGGVILAVGLLVLGIGLVRRPRPDPGTLGTE
jgi:hypothetical protein